jgi:hypothetical protein
MIAPDGGRAAREAHEAIDRAMALAHYTHTDARDSDCWFDWDRVPDDPATTAWKRLARWQQARWRDAQHCPIGFDPYGGGLRAKRVGSRMELAHARKTGANFLTSQILSAVRARLALREEHQVLDADQLFADLLASSALAFNLFGSLYESAEATQRALRAWWPELPQGEASLRFAHSPGRLDPAFLGSAGGFDASFEIEGPGGAAFLGIVVKYHEHAAGTSVAKPEALARYVAVAERSDVFRPGFQKALAGSPLEQLWHDHLLVLAMMQHGSQRWQHAKLVLVYPALNPSYALAAKQYRELLADGATFEAVTLESFLRAPGALDRAIRDALQARYL